MTVRRLPKSHEEKVAVKLSQLVNDYNLDIDEVGRYFARVSGIVAYNRIINIVEVAQVEKENEYVRNTSNPLF